MIDFFMNYACLDTFEKDIHVDHRPFIITHMNPSIHKHPDKHSKSTNSEHINISETADSCQQKKTRKTTLPHKQINHN